MALTGSFTYDSYDFPTAYNESTPITVYGACIRITNVTYNAEENYYEINGIYYDPLTYPTGYELHPVPV